MVALKVKGYELESFNLKGASQRKAIQLKNTIFTTLKKVAVSEDDIEVDLETVVIKKAKASASWYMEGQHLYFSYKGLSFIENLYVVSKIIELEVESLLNEKKTIKEFVDVFSEDHDIESKRKKARETLGVDEHSVDWDEIDKKYKTLAKEHHPDKGGSTDKFKEINHAHKLLKRELE
ncbi:MAG: DnaJ domain-containing protein [Nanoarchaeota archaeon]